MGYVGAKGARAKNRSWTPYRVADIRTGKQSSDITGEQHGKIKILWGQVDQVVVAPRGAGLAIEM